jgi:hypothetical protein
VEKEWTKNLVKPEKARKMSAYKNMSMNYTYIYKNGRGVSLFGEVFQSFFLQPLIDIPITRMITSPERDISAMGTTHRKQLHPMK